MIPYYIENMIDNYPLSLKQELSANPIQMNIVLEGGAFNGSYLTGCLFYLQELEKKGYIRIHKLSACSIGSLLSLGYFIKDKIKLLEINDLIYNIAYNQLKTKGNINIFEKVFELLKEYVTYDILQKVNNKLYITYFNVNTGKQKIVYKYKSTDHLLDVIRRSCSFPFIVDQNLSYKNKYIDGMYPYIFSKSQNSNRKTLYLNLHNYNYLLGALFIKNEKTNMKRIFVGLVDMHIFFTSKRNTEFCSYVHDWSLFQKLEYFLFMVFLKTLAFLFNKIFIINKIINKSTQNKKINIIKMIKKTYSCLVRMYCI